jgi:kynureninase
VRPDLARSLEPGLIGWAAHAEPFAFATGPVVYADGAERFQSGTPNVPALYAARAGYEIVASIGVTAIREKSLRLTRRIIDHAARAGYTINTPADDAERGGAVILDVPNGAAVANDLLRRNIIIDYRPDAGIRISPHFYNHEDDVDAAMRVLDEIVAVGAQQG